MWFGLGKEAKLAICDQIDKGGVLLLYMKYARQKELAFQELLMTWTKMERNDMQKIKEERKSESTLGYILHNYFKQYAWKRIVISIN